MTDDACCNDLRDYGICACRTAAEFFENKGPSAAPARVCNSRTTLARGLADKTGWPDDAWVQCQRLEKHAPQHWTCIPLANQPGSAVVTWWEEVPHD